MWRDIGSGLNTEGVWNGDMLITSVFMLFANDHILGIGKVPSGFVSLVHVIKGSRRCA